MKNASRWVAMLFAIIILAGAMACSSKAKEKDLDKEDQDSSLDVTEEVNDGLEEQSDQEELPNDYQHVIEIELLFAGELPENVFALDMTSLDTIGTSISTDFTIDESGRLIAYFGRGFMKDNVQNYGTRYEYIIYPRTEEGFLDLDNPINEPAELAFDNEGNCMSGDYFSVFLE